MKPIKTFIKLVWFTWLLSAVTPTAYAHSFEKQNGHVNVKDLLLPSDDLSFTEKAFMYAIDGLLILTAAILIIRLVMRKKTGTVLVLFLVLIVVDYILVFHYGNLLDLVG